MKSCAHCGQPYYTHYELNSTASSILHNNLGTKGDICFECFLHYNNQYKLGIVDSDIKYVHFHILDKKLNLYMGNPLCSSNPKEN